MKKTAALLAIVLMLATLVSMLPAQAYSTIGETIADYDEYGYYVYYDFENMGGATHFNYFGKTGSKNADNLLCNPFGFAIQGPGHYDGSAQVLEDEEGKYVRYTSNGLRDYNALAVFKMQDRNGKSYILGETLELSYRFRMGNTVDEDITANDRVALVNTRRGTQSGNYGVVTADKFGNVYAYVNSGTLVQVYKNADGKTVGGDGEFIKLVFRWYDVTNTYSLWINDKLVVEGVSLPNNYRAAEYVNHVFTDDFELERRYVKGATGDGSGSEDRTLEIFRFDKWDDPKKVENPKDYKLVYDVDEVKLTRVETAQGGAVYYENSFDGVNEGFSLRNGGKSVYLYAEGQNASNIFRSEADENGDRYLNLLTGKNSKNETVNQFFSLNDQHYQQFLQGNMVIEFSIKGTPFQTDGSRKAIVRLNDSQCMNMPKLLFYDANGYLYTSSSSSAKPINGYKLSEDEWLDIAIVVIKNHNNDGKFSSFNSSSYLSASGNTYHFSFYINGNYVGTTSHVLNKWNNSSYNKVKYTTSGRTYTITDYTVGGDVSALDLSTLKLLNDAPYYVVKENNKDVSKKADGHKIYTAGDKKTYYDVTFDANGNQTAYSVMVLSDDNKSTDENLRIFTDTGIYGKLDNIRIYEGSAPESAYVNANSDKGGKVVNVDFGDAVFPAGSLEARDYESGANVLGTIVSNAVTSANFVRKTADGEAPTFTMDAEYATANLNENNWFDFFVPMPKAVGGVYDFDYSFETTIRNIGFNAEDSAVPKSLDFFSPRLETNGYSAGVLLTLKNNFSVFAGADSTQLYNADGTPAKFDNANWSTFRVVLHFYKDEARTEITASYYLNGELLYLADGTPAFHIVPPRFSSEFNGRFGTTNFRFRYTQLGSGKKISMDIKNFSITANPKPVYTELDSDAALNDNVSVIELTLPKYENADMMDSYEALSIVKKAGGANQSMPLLRVSPTDNRVMIALMGRYYTLVDRDENPIKVGDAGLPIAIVYDDNNGTVRCYANGTIAYIKLNGERTAVVDINAYSYDFTQLDEVSDTKLVVFGGYATDNTTLDGEDYAISSYNIKDGDKAEIIGFQINDSSSGIRIVAGVDTLYYSKVGVELETFVGGVSMGKKTLSSNTVFGSIVANGNTVSAKELGYNYLSAIIIDELPKGFEADTYIQVRSYAEIEGYKHYDAALRLVVTNDGYYFVKDGVLYENDFGGATELPAAFTKRGDTTSTLSVTKDGVLAINSTASVVTKYYLNQNVGNDYIVQADFTWTGGDASRYYGLLMRYTNESSFIIAAFRPNGEAWIQVQKTTGWGDVVDFNLNELGVKIEKNKTYTLTGLCVDDYVAFFIDGVLLAEGKIPAGYEKGHPGIATSGISLEVDNFIVRQPEKVTKEVALYENDFDGLSALPTDWKTAISGNASVSVADGKIAFAESTGLSENRSFIYLDKDFGKDYSVEADITVTAQTGTDRQEFAFVYAYESTTDFAFAYTTGTYSKLQMYKGGTYKNTDANSEYKYGFTVGKTYKFKAVCTDGLNVELYIDGNKVASGTFSTGYPAGKIGFEVCGASIIVDNVKVLGETEVYDTDYVYYTQSFDSATSDWDRHASACRSYTEDFSLSVVDGKLVASDVNSGLTVVALNKDIDFGDNFVYEATISMDRAVNKYMGLAFGLQEDGRCAMYTMYVPSGKWNLEAWYTDQKVDKVINSAWVNYATSGDNSSLMLDNIAANTEYRIKLVFENGIVTAFVDGEKIAEVAVGDKNLHSGKFGFVFRESVVTLDNVRITKLIDKYEISDGAGTGTRLRVATFNIGDFSTASGTSGDGLANGNGTEVTKAEYRAVFEKVGADIWGLQEDSKYFNGSTKENPYDAVYSASGHANYERNYTGSYNGKAFLTDYEIYDVKPIYYEMRELDQSQMTDYSHPWFLTAKIKVDGKEIAVATLHFEWSCKELRRHQIDQVIEWAKQHTYSIIIGDVNPDDCIGIPSYDSEGKWINHTPLSDKSTHVVDNKVFTDAGFVPANCGRFGTFYTIMKNGQPRSESPCDNIYVSPNIRIINAEAIYEPWMSDHAIVVADIEIN